MTATPGALLGPGDPVKVARFTTPLRQLSFAHTPRCPSVRSLAGLPADTVLDEVVTMTLAEALDVAWADGCIDLASLPPGPTPPPVPLADPDGPAWYSTITALYDAAMVRDLDAATFALAARLAVGPPAHARPRVGVSTVDYLAVVDAGWSQRQADGVLRLVHAHPVTRPTTARALADALDSISDRQDPIR